MQGYRKSFDKIVLDDKCGSVWDDYLYSGQSQFAPLKLRSLALVTSSGALSRLFELHSWQLHCETVPSAPKRSSHRLAVVPRPGSAGPGARGIRKKERRTNATAGT